MLSIQHRGNRFAGVVLGTCLLLVVGSVTAPAASAVAADSASAAASTQSHHRDDKTDPVLMFAADGMRQDLIEKYIGERRGALPGFAELLRHGASASGGGMLTQAPPNTGAGWYTMATGAWPGVTGSTNNTFHINTQPLGQSTAAFGTGVLQAETIAQSAERGGKKVIQMEWAGGRNGAINGPTVDFRSFFSGRGVTTTFTSPSTDRTDLITSFGLQYDQVELTNQNGCLGRIYFHVPGGIKTGQHWLKVKFAASEVHVPFRILTKEEAKEFSKTWEDLKDEHDANTKAKQNP